MRSALLSFLLAWTASAQGLPTHVRMQQVVKAFSQLGSQDFPNVSDSRLLDIASDGTFGYSGPTTYQYGNKNRRVTYSGRVDLALGLELTRDVYLKQTGKK
jgi:hypothetical protein